MRLTEEEFAQLMARRQAAAALPPAVTSSDEPEARLLSKVLRLAKQHGYRVYHTHDSRRSEEGFPDVVLCREDGIIFAELKSSTGKPTMDQTVWLHMLQRTGQVEVYLWRPADWRAIQARLTRPVRFC